MLYSPYATHSAFVIHHQSLTSVGAWSDAVPLKTSAQRITVCVALYFLAIKENPQVIHPATTSMEPVSTSQTGKSSMIGSGCQTASVSLFCSAAAARSRSAMTRLPARKTALDVKNGMAGSLGVRSRFTGRLWCVRMARKDLDPPAEADSLDWELAWQRRQVNVFALEPNTMKYDWATLALRKTTWRELREGYACKCFTKITPAYLIHCLFHLFVFKNPEQNTLTLCTIENILRWDHPNPCRLQLECPQSSFLNAFWGI